MDALGNTFCELVSIIKLWIPWRCEPPNVSRDFWMPDQSCRVCYECDSQFTLFNRRHHCRLCGRIFCAKCTANLVPAPSTSQKDSWDESERIRVCNYCYKQWEQGVVAFDNGIQVSNLDPSSLLSTSSLVSSKTSVTANSSNITLSSMPYSIGSHQQMQQGSSLSQQQSPVRGKVVDREAVSSLRGRNDLVADQGDRLSKQYGFSMNSSNDEDECSVYQSDSETMRQVNGYYVHVDFDGINETDGSELLSPKDVQNHSKNPGMMNEEQNPLKEEFPPSPSDHQSILASLSSRCVWKRTVCEKTRLLRIKYYGSFDKPLGRFLRDHLFDETYQCHTCDMPSEAHVHCYTHRQGTLTISVKRIPEFILPGEREGKIWMWHRCLRVPRIYGFSPATRRIVMSDAAWGLSFGKFLELSFSNHAAASRVASCGHSLHRDCLHFYGFGEMVACFRYASIDVHSVYLPPHKLNFDYGNQDWIQKESDEVVNRVELLFSEVLNALGQIGDERSSAVPVSGTLKTPELRRQVAELEGMLQKEKVEFEEALQKILNQEKKKGQPWIDILEINRLHRQLLFQCYMWDHRLIYAASAANSSRKSRSTGSISEEKERSIDENQLIVNPILVDSKLDESPILGGGVDGKLSQSDASHQEFDKAKDIDYEKGDQPNSSISKSVCDHSDLLDRELGVHRALSNGQFAVLPSLSDTLDAKWMDENHSGVGIQNNNTSVNPDTFMGDSLTTTTQKETYNSGDHAEDQNGLKSIYSSHKGDGNMEESLSWFYHQFNKNIFASTQKFDALVDYNPVYVSSFRELELQSGARLLLPIGVNDTVIPVYDDEPSSIVAYSLMSPEYRVQMTDEGERPKDGVDMMTVSGSRNSLMLDPMLYTKAMHARVSFEEDSPRGKVKYSVTSYYAKRFEALRRVCCPSELDYIRSLSRCKKWRAQGGKSNAFFAKTLDDRFIIKQVTKSELESFIKFGPDYFKYLSESIGSSSPTCLAKILGIYQVTSKHLKGGKETKMDVLVMENLLFRRTMTRLYDLKGSSRYRYNPDSSGSNKVLLDQNLIEAMPTSPIFVGNKAKRLLERAVWNDTCFLASIDVMDYSLLAGVDEEKHELVIGIIDFMRQYKWDMHFETCAKASCILGGSKNASPTIIPPKQYKKRFRKAMSTYFIMLPDQWSPSSITPSHSQSDLCEDNTQSRTSVE